MPSLPALPKAVLLPLAWLAWLLPTGSADASPSPPTLAECHGIKDLAFAAHLDDDLLFMNPDIAANIEAGGCVRVVYLTASERGEGEGYMLGRERGVRAAYAYMAQQPDAWAEDTATVGAYHIARFTLQGNPRVQLWHMRLEDPWLGEGWGSLTPLSQAESVAGKTAETLGPYRQSYGRADLVQTLAGIIRGYGPTTVRHLDDTISVPYTQLCWRCAGHGHPDHIASGRLVREAMAMAPGNYAQMGYVDYPSQEHVANLAEAEIASKSEIFRRYAWKDYRYCSGPQNCQEPAGPAAAWVQRAYYVSRHDGAPGLFADARGSLAVLATGEINDAVNFWDGNSRSWRALGGRTVGPLASFSYPDSAAGVMARDTLGGLWVNKQDPDGAWRGWQAMGGPRFARVPAVAGGDAAALALGYDGLYYWTRPAGTGSAWLAWQPLPVLTGATGNGAIARDAAGRLVAFAVDNSGRLFATMQHGGNGEGWTPWQAIPAPETDAGLAALRNAAGLIELYLRDRATGRLLRVVQAPTSAGRGPAASLPSRWGTATDLGVQYVGTPAIARDENGEIAVAVLEHPDGALWLIQGGKATQLAAHAASPPSLRLLNGSLHVVARGAGPAQSYQVLARSKGAWAAAASIGDLPAGGGGPFGMGSIQAGGTLAAASVEISAPATLR